MPLGGTHFEPIKRAPKRLNHMPICGVWNLPIQITNAIYERPQRFLYVGARMAADIAGVSGPLSLYEVKDFLGVSVELRKRIDVSGIYYSHQATLPPTCTSR